MKGRLPNFMIIGAMKAGTSSLHNYLFQHPEIFMSETKEIHYFADAIYQNHDINWYMQHFLTDRNIIGTSPQNYTKCHNKYYQNIPARIKRDIPDIKFIYILRDPIERYKSHILENYYGEPSADVTYNVQSGHYIKTGLYYLQLKEYLNYFPLDCFHILTLEDLIRDKLGTLNKIFKFLGTYSLEDASAFEFVSNSHQDKILPHYVSNSLLYRGLNKLFPSAVEQALKFPVTKNLMFSRGKKKEIEPEELEKLQEIYRQDKYNLEKLTGIKFHHWDI